MKHEIGVMIGELKKKQGYENMLTNMVDPKKGVKRDEMTGQNLYSGAMH